MRQRKGMNFWQIAITIVGLILVARAIQEQLSLPADERNWYGKVWGIPYDFRLPTLERMREAFWNENTSQILMPHVFGVGWSINFYPLLHPQVQ